jgi:uncharacterized membrane protein
VGYNTICMTQKPQKQAAANKVHAWHHLAQAIVISNAISIGLMAVRFMAATNYRYWFLLWNLFLAWLPLLFAWLFRRTVANGRLLSWQSGALLAAWLGFLPNSFYILSDYVHLRATYEVSLLFDVVLFASFVWNGFLAGFMATYTVHSELRRRLTGYKAHAVIGGVLLLCSFAIYLGRFLRWNTWDVIINPGGLLFDVSDRVLNPSSYPRTFATTGTFFVLLAGMYAVIWYLVAYLRATRQP